MPKVFEQLFFTCEKRNVKTQNLSIINESYEWSLYEKMIAYNILRRRKRLFSRYSIAIPVLEKWASVASIFSVIIVVLKEKTNDKLGVIRAITRIFVTPIGN